MDNNQAFSEPVTTAPAAQHAHTQTHPTPAPVQQAASQASPNKPQRQRRNSGSGTTAPKSASTAKSVTLTFSSPEELAIHDQIAKAAADDDRSVNQFIVRVLMGKETMPSAGARTATE